ncbi:hypothetical protein TrLO_g7535 [Triparma laevis f. longispina]|uniref:Uncharacterized protein n=1 Tax=Triparma laevis f. longispina TaxID=1714387 RepID=A0A9W7FAL4_9STRA|nr:hypothetical protein TrLO_g7535 [Triparma laevis f. longispina]
MLRRVFLEGDDVSKSQVFKKHRAIWKPLEEKVKAWVKAGWKQWGEEKPEWFTDDWKLKVPKYMLSATVAGDDSSVVVSSVVVRQEARRKGSLPALINAALGIEHAAAKIIPAGNVKRDDFDFDEFKRVMERRGSILIMNM